MLFHADIDADTIRMWANSVIFYIDCAIILQSKLTFSVIMLTRALDSNDVSCRFAMGFSIVTPYLRVAILV